MIIIELILVGYKRFFLNNIHKIVYKPKAKTQIILGQNGVGKSSLLERLTPLSLNMKKDFNKDGYEKKTIEHNGSMYIIHAKQCGGYSFILDNVEQNHGGTVTVQNDLVKYHFGVTPNIYNIVLGKNSFCNMSFVERKRWLTEISNIDYSYSISVYNSLKKRHRDIVGGIKILQNNIISIKKSKVSDEVLCGYKDEVSHLCSIIDHLHTLIVPNITVGDIGIGFDNIKVIMSGIEHVNAVDCTALTTLDTNIIKLTAELGVLYRQRIDLYDDLDKLESVIDTDATEAIKVEYQKLLKEIRDRRVISSLDSIENIVQTHSFMCDNFTTIIELLSEFSEDGYSDVTNTTLTNKCELRDGMVSTLECLDRRRYKLEERIDRINSLDNAVDDVTCPKCTHKWIFGVNDSSLSIHISELEKLVARIGILNNKKDDVINDIDGIMVVKTRLATMKTIFNNSNDTRLILSNMFSNENYTSTGTSALRWLFEDIYHDVCYIYDTNKLRVLSSELLLKITDLDNKRILSRDVIDVNKQNILDKISVVTHTEARLKRELDMHDKDKVSIRLQVKSINKLHGEIKELYQLKNMVLTKKRNNIIANGIVELRSMVNSINLKITLCDDNIAALDRYQVELDKLNITDKVLKIVICELSPTEGLIAKSMSSFLDKFIYDMNTILGTIWEYPIELLSSDLSSGDLDYKFKVLINSMETIEDINKTSSSMQEIINVVFKIVFSKYIGFIDYPLILDEFGKTFDTIHRVSAYEVLEKNIATDFSQVYMVSHFEEMHGRLSSSSVDVSILSTTGVSYSDISNYNEIMEITYI